MTKTDKKRDKQICQALTLACEAVKQQLPEFQWLTHDVNYRQFPESLKIRCFFESKETLELALQHNKQQLIIAVIEKELAAIGIHFKKIERHIFFDSE